MDDHFEGRIEETWHESKPWWPKKKSAPAGAPNFLVILLDDVGFSDIGCFGSEIRTPNIDRLANAGLRFRNFHVTPMCSPTRACLLTGRNAHKVGMGFLADFDSGFPGYRGRVPASAAMAPEILREHGYSTLAIGKWHLTPGSEISAVGPFRNWPLAKGFDRWYGFQGALADQWHPDLWEDQHPVETPSKPGYHLSEDLCDRAIDFLVDQRVAMPESPFFMYLAFGAAHWPHQVPKNYIDRYRGRYDQGWDQLRTERLETQKRLGIVPAETQLAPSNPGVRAWDSLKPEVRTLCARYQEVFSAFLEHTDAQIGRVIAHLEETGQFENTCIVLLSDNGASPEGGPIGAVNTRKQFLYEPETLDEGLAAMDALGSDQSFSHYPIGWAQAGNTPLKWFKTDTHGGGVRAPLIVHWPRKIAAPGIRAQFHHVTDILPTCLEIVGIQAPAESNGVPQIPVQGTSLLYAFDAPEAPTRKTAQYFELLGDRGIWHGGWKAVTHHRSGDDFAKDRWELYRLDDDFSECKDLAGSEPERLADMIALWNEEARANSVLPLDDRLFPRVAPLMKLAPTRFTYLPRMSRTDRIRSPNIAGRSYRIIADVQVCEGDEGVILAAGTRFAGYALFLKNGRVTYEYVYDEHTHFRIVANRKLTPGAHVLRYEFKRLDPVRGRGAMFANDELLGSAEIGKTWPIRALNTGMMCGQDGVSPKSRDYAIPFAFTGIITQVRVELDDDQEGDAYANYHAYRAAHAED